MTKGKRGGGVSCHDKTEVEFGHDKFAIREGGSFVMTKLKLSLVMTSLLSEEGGGGSFVMTKLKFGPDERPPPPLFKLVMTKLNFSLVLMKEAPPPLFKLVMTKIIFSLVMTRVSPPPPHPLCLQLRLSGDLLYARAYHSRFFFVYKWLTKSMTSVSQ